MIIITLNQNPSSKKVELIFPQVRKLLAQQMKLHPFASFRRFKQTVEETIHADSSVHMEPRPYDACFAWYTPSSGTRQRLDRVDDIRLPAPTVETNFDNEQTTTLQQAFGGFQEVAAETGSLYERLRQGAIPPMMRSRGPWTSFNKLLYTI